MTPRCRHQLRATPTHHLTSREWPEPRPSLTHPGGGGDPPLGGKLREAQKGTQEQPAAYDVRSETIALHDFLRGRSIERSFYCAESATNELNTASLA